MNTIKQQSRLVFLVDAPRPSFEEFRSVSEERADERRRLLGRKGAAAAIRSPIVAALGGIIR